MQFDEEVTHVVKSVWELLDPQCQVTDPQCQVTEQPAGWRDKRDSAAIFRPLGTPFNNQQGGLCVGTKDCGLHGAERNHQPLRDFRVQPCQLSKPTGVQCQDIWKFPASQPSGGALRRGGAIFHRTETSGGESGQSLAASGSIVVRGHLPISIKYFVCWVMYRLLVRLVAPQKWFHLLMGRIQLNSGICYFLCCEVSTVLHPLIRRKYYKCHIPLVTQWSAYHFFYM